MAAALAAPCRPGAAGQALHSCGRCGRALSAAAARGLWPIALSRLDGLGVGAAGAVAHLDAVRLMWGRRGRWGRGERCAGFDAEQVPHSWPGTTGGAHNTGADGREAGQPEPDCCHAPPGPPPRDQPPYPRPLLHLIGHIKHSILDLLIDLARGVDERLVGAADSREEGLGLAVRPAAVNTLLLRCRCRCRASTAAATPATISLTAAAAAQLPLRRGCSLALLPAVGPAAPTRRKTGKLAHTPAQRTPPQRLPLPPPRGEPHLLHVVRRPRGRFQEDEPVLLGKLLAFLCRHRTPVLSAGGGERGSEGRPRRGKRGLEHRGAGVEGGTGGQQVVQRSAHAGARKRARRSRRGKPPPHPAAGAPLPAARPGWQRALPTASLTERSDLFPMSMMVMLGLACCRASSSQLARWLKVSRLRARIGCAGGRQGRTSGAGEEGGSAPAAGRRQTAPNAPVVGGHAALLPAV
jgi:hypothetical protein